MEVLDKESLQQKVPAAFAESPFNKVSAKYSFLPTSELISELSRAGWMPVSASQVQTRSTKRMPYAKHLVRFREDKGAYGKEVSPEIVLLNSHNASSSLQIRFGMYRFACANGLVLGEDLIETMRFRHIHYQMGDILKAIDTVKENADQWMDVVDSMKGIASESIAEDFANKAIDKFYNRENKTWNWQELARPQRSADNPNTLWHLFNVVQEHILQGGIPYTVVTKRNKVMNQHTRKITSPDRQLEVNQKLFDMALGYLY